MSIYPETVVLEHEENDITILKIQTELGLNDYVYEIDIITPDGKVRLSMIDELAADKWFGLLTSSPDISEISY